MGQDPCSWSLLSITADDLDVVLGLGVGEFHHVVAGLHRRLSGFIHSVVVHRRVGGGIGFGKIL